MAEKASPDNLEQISSVCRVLVILENMSCALNKFVHVRREKNRCICARGIEVSCNNKEGMEVNFFTSYILPRSLALETYFKNKNNRQYGTGVVVQGVKASALLALA